MTDLKQTPRPTSITFQDNGLVAVIRKGAGARLYSGPHHRRRLLAFCAEKRLCVATSKIGLIYRNWR